MAFSTAVHAAETAKPVGGGATTLGEVIVTAQKRSENIQRTAVAVSAFSTTKIAQAGLAGPQQLQFNVPSMTYGQESGFTFITMRGIGTDIAGSAGGQTSVATYLDGVYTGGLIAASVPNFDLQRIEVLRGPQGTLYGRNATGGVINYISTPPSFDPGAYASVSYGNYNSTSDDLGVTGPILSDKVAGRLSLHYGQHDGYRYNLFLRRHEDADETYSGRGTILFQPTSQLSITLRGDVSHDRSSTPYELLSQATLFGGVTQELPLGVFSVPAADLPVGTLSPADLALLNGQSIATHFGLIQPGPLAPDPNHSLDFVSTERTSFLTDSDGASVTIDWNPGPVDFKSISAYRYARLYWFSDSIGDGTPEVQYAPGLSRSRQFTQEFDISGQAFDSRLTWLAGAYYLHDDAIFETTIWLPADGQYFAALASFTNPAFDPNVAPGPANPMFTLAGGYDAAYFTHIQNIYSTIVTPTPPYGGGRPLLQPFVTIPETAFLGFAASQTSQSIAGFGQATFKITPELRITGGVRFTQDKTNVVRTLHSNLVNTLIGLDPLGGSLAADIGVLCDRVPSSHTWTAPTGTVGLDYDAAPHVLTYAKASWGYKSGGYNVGQCAGNFNPEYLTDYEGGVKAVFADGQALTNLAIYYYDYSNIQFTTFVQNASAILNAGKATAFGVELEYALRPNALPGFQVDGALSFEDSHYGHGCFQDPAFILQPSPTSTDEPVCPNPGEEIKGNELIRAPRWKTNFGAQYTMDLGATGSIMVRGDAAWTDKIYNDILNGKGPFISATTQRPYWIVNARLVWTSADKRYEAEVFGNNITNSLYATNRVAFNTPAMVENVTGQFAPPATYGVRFTMRFGSAIR
jgi:iron complex outermembrane receptor protein